MPCSTLAREWLCSGIKLGARFRDAIEAVATGGHSVYVQSQMRDVGGLKIRLIREPL
jgi:hypothetical protein